MQVARFAAKPSQPTHNTHNHQHHYTQLLHRNSSTERCFHHTEQRRARRQLGQRGHNLSGNSAAKPQIIFGGSLDWKWLSKFIIVLQKPIPRWTVYKKHFNVFLRQFPLSTMQSCAGVNSKWNGIKDSWYRLNHASKTMDFIQNEHESVVILAGLQSRTRQKANASMLLCWCLVGLMITMFTILVYNSSWGEGIMNIRAIHSMKTFHLKSTSWCWLKELRGSKS